MFCKISLFISAHPSNPLQQMCVELDLDFFGHLLGMYCMQLCVCIELVAVSGLKVIRRHCTPFASLYTDNCMRV